MTRQRSYFISRVRLLSFYFPLLLGSALSSQPGWTSSSDNGVAMQQHEYEQARLQDPLRNSQQAINTASASTVAEQPRNQQEAQLVPKINSAQIALSLRLTCEMNRRLRLGTATGLEINFVAAPEMHHIPPGNPLGELSSEPLTIFHATKPRDETGRLRGIERWGPDPQTYIQQIVNLLELSENEKSVVLSLAMIYLDRSSSVETVRTNGAPSCPFCTARTVHRLFLSAAMIAGQVALGCPLGELYNKVEKLGIPARELDEMQMWMKIALGDDGYFVSANQLLSFKQTWENIFRKEQPQPDNTGSSRNREQPLVLNSDRQTAPSGFFSTAQQPAQKVTRSSPQCSHHTDTDGGPTQTSQQSADYMHPPAFHNSNRVSVYSG